MNLGVVCGCERVNVLVCGCLDVGVDLTVGVEETRVGGFLVDAALLICACVSVNISVCACKWVCGCVVVWVC